MTLSSPAAPPATRRATRAKLAVAIGVADVRREPDVDSELVTQALMGARATALETAPNGWARVRLADYEGWVESEYLASPSRASERVAVVATPRAPLYTRASGATTLGEVYATSILSLTASGQRPESDRARVALPGGRHGWLTREDFTERPASEPFPRLGVEAALALAHRLLGTPYHWGGVTACGIDCSGLSQLACRAGGALIPRDADQQYAALPFTVDRASVRAGDLVYFASGGAITHVGIALDNMTLLHASGSGARVIITSLDPAEGGYSAKLADMYAGARRPFPDAPDNGDTR
ncbi:MAG TPA: SH3 domain-containing C40 family peptidase [Ktedonobacterales bacterium]|nr:SH3 domain-containing C40 family peptidase [Ktedonobacterales bacterium]